MQRNQILTLGLRRGLPHLSPIVEPLTQFCPSWAFVVVVSMTTYLSILYMTDVFTWVSYLSWEKGQVVEKGHTGERGAEWGATTTIACTAFPAWGLSHKAHHYIAVFFCYTN